jgi:hypothetical protein
MSQIDNTILAQVQAYTRKNPTSNAINADVLGVWQTMKEVFDSLQPIAPTYKVYTALLTQSGGDDLLALASGAVTKGVTYQIDGSSNGDFSNVGAPNNNDGTLFVATTNETPNDYENASLIYNNGAPVATVLENTIGNIWFTYGSGGIYNINSNALFTLDKTYSVPYMYSSNGDLPNGIFIENIDIDSSQIISMFNSSREDGQLLNTPIEIRVYS